MSWLTLTIIAQFLQSIVALLDKYLVTSKRITTPLLYVFYTGVLTILGIAIYLPSLFFQFPGLPKFASISLISSGVFVLVIIAAACQLIALWGLFSALKKNDASDVVPVIGSLAAIFALIISFISFGTLLPHNFTFGFALLILGTLFISHLRFSKKTFGFALVGGMSFALHGILLKEVLSQTSFETGFFWFTIMMPILALFLLFVPSIRNTFISHKKEKHIKSTGVILIINKLIAGLAGVLLIKAIELGEVSMVQALGGIQFLFVFIIALIIGPYTSIDFGENHKRKDVYQKLIAVTIIFLGFVLLFT